MGISEKNLYVDEKGVKRCRFLGKEYPKDCTIASIRSKSSVVVTTKITMEKD